MGQYSLTKLEVVNNASNVDTHCSFVAIIGARLKLDA